MDGPPLVGELMEGEYSLTLRLTLINLTAQDSGMYRCSATKLVTGQHSHQDTLVTVAGVCLGVSVLKNHVALFIWFTKA